MERLWHKRLRDFESFDKIELVVVPRYKTSGLSGDEWRQSIVARFWFKGEMVHECGGWHSMKTALMLLAGDWFSAQEPIPERVIDIEKTACDQPSCAEKAIGRYLIKRETASDGSWLAPSESGFAHFRRFCAKHARRGDGGREDADDNYEPLDTLRPEQSTNTQTSPAIFGGVIRIDAPDNGEPPAQA